MLSVFCSPARYVQGRDATASLGAEMTTLGLHGPVLVVASRAARAELGATWDATFAAAGMTHVIHAFGGECTLAEIERIVTSARTAGARTKIGRAHV